MCEDKNEDDESGGTQGGQGTPPTSMPSNRPQRIQTDIPPSRDPPEGRKVNPDQSEEYSEPTLGEFDSYEELGNGYKLVSDGERWLLFDDEDQFIGEFEDREEAENEAYRRKPLPRFGI